MRDTVFFSLIIVLLLAVLGLQFLSPGGSQVASVYPPEEVRKFAAKLESDKLFEQAVKEYENYLTIARIQPDQRANLLYKIGTIYLDELHDYENALAAFLRISNFYPQSQIAREAEKRMIRCYEELNRGYDAQKRLEKLTDLNPQDPQGTGPMVAKVGDKVITLDQIENEIAQMPDYLKAQYSTPEKKAEYLRTKVFQELLYDMALRKEYQKDPEIRKQVFEFEKATLAQKAYSEETAANISITQNDLDLYYKAHPEEFTTPARARVAHILLKTKADADTVAEQLESGAAFEEMVKQHSTDEASKGRDGVVGMVQEQGATVPGIGNAPEIAATLIALDQGAVSEPVESANGFHIFKIVEKTPAKVTPFQDALELVKQRVSQMKEQEYQQELVNKMIQAERVKLFEQVILNQTKPAAQPSGQ